MLAFSPFCGLLTIGNDTTSSAPEPTAAVSGMPPAGRHARSPITELPRRPER